MEKIGAIVDVSVFHGNSLQWQPNDKLFDVQFDWTAIQQGAKELLFIHSANDPYVPLIQAQYVSTKSGGERLLFLVKVTSIYNAVMNISNSLSC